MSVFGIYKVELDGMELAYLVRAIEVLYEKVEARVALPPEQRGVHRIFDRSDAFVRTELTNLDTLQSKLLGLQAHGAAERRRRIR